MVESPRELSARLLEAFCRKAREALMRGAAARTYLPGLPAPVVTDAALAAMQAEATARAKADTSSLGGGRSVGAALPPAVRATAKIRAKHESVHQADLRPIARETDAAVFYAKVRAAAAARPHLGISLHAIEKFAETIVYLERKDGVGYVQRALQALGKFSRYCARHIQRLKDWFEANNLIDIVNTKVRTGAGVIRRGANVYVPTVDRSPAPLPADVEDKDPVVSAAVSRALGGMNRLAALFGLHRRPWGLNTTPSRKPIQDTG